MEEQENRRLISIVILLQFVALSCRINAQTFSVIRDIQQHGRPLSIVVASAVGCILCGGLFVLVL
jgi:hypothetical protein